MITPNIIEQAQKHKIEISHMIPVSCLRPVVPADSEFFSFLYDHMFSTNDVHEYFADSILFECRLRPSKPNGHRSYRHWLAQQIYPYALSQYNEQTGESAETVDDMRTVDEDLLLYYVNQLRLILPCGIFVCLSSPWSESYYSTWSRSITRWVFVETSAHLEAELARFAKHVKETTKAKG